MIKVKSTIFLLLFFISVKGQLQSPSPSILGQVNISSPNTAALGKYVDVPVNYHTGLPTIGIPIYTVQSGNISLPINLSYHASGLKVQEQASNVGAGWSLNAGGMITRTVMGLPDEKFTNLNLNEKGYLSDGGVLEYYFKPLSNFGVNDIGNTAIADGKEDGEPDLFTFNFCGMSGKFYLRDDKMPMIVPEQDIKIEYIYQPGTEYNQYYSAYGYGKSIQAFKITAKDGTKYYFGIYDEQLPSENVYPIEIVQPFAYYNGGGAVTSRLITGWYLYKIESLDGKNIINLDYKKDMYATIQPQSLPNYNYIVKNLVNGIKLSAVRFANGRVDFMDGVNRQDLVHWEGNEIEIEPTTVSASKSLGKIKIFDNTGNCKTYNFYHSFTVDNVTEMPTVIKTSYPNLQTDKKRLRLDSMAEESCDGLAKLPAYKFGYFTEKVTRSVCYGMDHWGFMNGAANDDLLPPLTQNNNPIIPYFPSNMPNPPAIPGYAGIANRNPSWPAMRGGTLNNIVYPTGGQAVYEYEPNMVKINSQNTMIGGIRIKSITQKDGVNLNQDIVTNFDYNNSDGYSSGVLQTRPSYIQILRNDIYKKFKVTEFSNACGNSVMANINAPYRTSRVSILPLRTVQGHHVGYESVKVTKTNNGASIFKYYVDDNLKNINSIAVTNFNHNNTPGDCIEEAPNYPPAPIKYDFLYGELKQEVHLTEQGNTIKEKKYFPFYKENKIKIYGVKAIYGGTFYILCPASNPCPYGIPPSQTEILSTIYELSTSKKLKDSIVEIDYMANSSNPLTSKTVINYNSNYHTEATNVVKENSKGEKTESNIRYSNDFIASSILAMQNDDAEYDAFVNAWNKDKPVSATIAQQLMTCNTLSGAQNIRCKAAVYIDGYVKPLIDARRAWINKRKLLYTNQAPLNTYQTLHDNEKSMASNDWKAILWMQDVGINAPIEFTNWKDGKLLNANYTSYKNYNNDIYTNYPFKQFQLKLNTPTTNYTNTNIATNNIQKDTRYREEVVVDYFKGNLINSKPYVNVNTAYQWWYKNTLPIAKVINAKGVFKDQINTQVTSIPLSVLAGSTAGSGGTTQYSFYKTTVGDIQIVMPSACAPPGATFNLSYTITSASTNAISGSFNNYNIGNCNMPMERTHPNLPIGNYTITVGISSSFSSYTFSKNINLLYDRLYTEPVVVPDAGSEFFTENFEYEFTYTAGAAQSGKKYCTGNYYVSFIPPNSRQYIIQWFNLVNNKWKFNEQNYVTGMTLTGPVDNIRILPNDALISTYAYTPILGITCETDHNGNSKYYEYDNLHRLSLIRDQDNNILKKICYNYAGQVEDCPLVNNTTPRWVATGNTRCQPCPANSLYNTGIKEKEEKDINPTSPTYNNPPRWVIDPTGTCPSPQNWVATGNTRCQPCAANPTYNSGVKEREEKDMNPCSSAGTGNTTRWVVDASLGTCPSLADWQQRPDLATCETNTTTGANTGNQLIPTRDINPCSGTFGQWGTPIIIPNSPSCPVGPICNKTCIEPQYKCINNVCVSGIWSVIKATKISKLPLPNGTWECIRAWCFPDGTQSTYTETTTGTTVCSIECF
jgi:hypothetical protein